LGNVAEAAVETPEVVECHRMTGEDCYLLTAHVRDVEQLEEVIDRFAALGQTTTSILQSSPVAGRGLAVGYAPKAATSSGGGMGIAGHVLGGAVGPAAKD
jgi:hypothetical protein